jgi:hypothetical protein
LTTLRGVQSHELPEHWPEAARLLKRALRFAPDHTLESVRRSLEAGERQLFLALPDLDLAVVTSIEIRPAAKVLFVFAVAGKLPPDWPRLLAELEGWARATGCAAVETIGRPGWLRKAHGYDARMILFRKDLKP